MDKYTDPHPHPQVRRDTHEEEPWSFDDLGANSAEISYFLNGYLNSFLLMIGA